MHEEKAPGWMKPSSRPRFRWPLEALQKGLQATKIRLAVLDALSRGKARRTAALPAANAAGNATDKRYRPELPAASARLRIAASAQIKHIAILMVASYD